MKLVGPIIREHVVGDNVFLSSNVIFLFNIVCKSKLHTLSDCQYVCSIHPGHLLATDKRLFELAFLIKK